MREDNDTGELLRQRFHHGDPTRPLRHRARSVMQDTCAGLVDADSIDDVLVVLSELVQNVSQHTGSDGEFAIRVQHGDVVVEVGDTSTTVPQVQRPDPLRVGGRGLWLIDAIAQQWGVWTCADGKVVWARLPARRVAPRESPA